MAYKSIFILVIKKQKNHFPDWGISRLKGYIIYRYKLTIFMLDFSLEISESVSLPKYKQLVNSVVEQIQSGRSQYGQKIPSINQISFDYNLSRDTVEKAYKILKKDGVIQSVEGRGHFIANANPRSELKILVLFNKLSSCKKEIYNAFSAALGKNKTIDFYIYHNQYELFEKKINEQLSGYNYYVIIPHFSEYHPKKVNELLQKINPEKIIILDHNINGVNHYGSCIYQDFKMDIYNTLMSAKQLLNKYKNLILVFPDIFNNPYPDDIIQGFIQFCGSNDFKNEIIHEINQDHKLKKESAYIIIDESDLINLIKIQRNSNLKLAEDIGILSYNDSPLKEVLANGISVITTDFQNMGWLAANAIIEKTHFSIRNNFRLIQRSSL